MGVFFPGYARVKRALRVGRRRPFGLASFVSVVTLLAQWFRMVMGVSYAVDEDDNEAGSSRGSVFAGDSDDYFEWAFRTKAYMRTKKVQLAKGVRKSLWACMLAKKPSLVSYSFATTLKDITDKRKAAGTWEALGADDDARMAAAKAVVRDMISSAKKADKVKLKRWRSGQQSVYDFLCMRTKGSASRVLQGIKDGDGAGCWEKLKTEYSRSEGLVIGSSWLGAFARAVRCRRSSRA